MAPRKKKTQTKHFDLEEDQPATIECPICYIILTTQQFVEFWTVRNCGHVLCANCARALVNGPDNLSNCPLCRTRLVNERSFVVNKFAIKRAREAIDEDDEEEKVHQPIHKKPPGPKPPPPPPPSGIPYRV